MASSDEIRSSGAGAARVHRTPTTETSFGATPSVPASDELQEIRQLAYEYYLARGEQAGHAEEDWIRAEQEVRRRRSSQQGGPSAASESSPQTSIKRGLASSSKKEAASRTGFEPRPVATRPVPGAQGTPHPQTRSSDNRLDDGSVGNPNVTKKPKR